MTICTAEPADFDRLPGGQRVAVTGGCAVEPQQAVIGAVMETIERYCGAFDHVKADEKRRALDERYLTHARFPIYADHQFTQADFPFKRVDPNSEIRWSKGEVLTTGEPRWVPTAWVQVPFTPSGPDELICCSTSSGMAAGLSRDQAIVNGLLELCERDAFMLTWLHRRSGPVMEPDLAALVGPAVAHSLASQEISPRFVDITNDLGVPAALCMVRTATRWGTLASFGVSAKISMKEACTKALCEAVSERRRCLDRLGELGDDFKLEDLHLRDFPDRPLAYLGEQNAAALAFLDCSKARSDWTVRLTDVPGAADRLSALVQHLSDRAGELIVVDLTTDDVADLGVRVIKVVAPDLAALDADHRYPFLGARRVAAIRNEPAEPLNPLPHPLA